MAFAKYAQMNRERIMKITCNSQARDKRTENEGRLTKAKRNNRKTKNPGRILKAHNN